MGWEGGSVCKALCLLGNGEWPESHRVSRTRTKVQPGKSTPILPAPPNTEIQNIQIQKSTKKKYNYSARAPPSHSQTVE